MPYETTCGKCFHFLRNPQNKGHDICVRFPPSPVVLIAPPQGNRFAPQQMGVPQQSVNFMYSGVAESNPACGEYQHFEEEKTPPIERQ